MSKGKVVVGMSGGVDSSVAAWLLKEQGYDVIGVTMQIWQDEENEVQEENGGCCGLSAVDDARRVASSIGIPYYVMNFKQEFQKNVIDYFTKEYLNGRTPNPCIACNRYVKWEALLQRSLSIGADYIATGHYARVEHHEGKDSVMLKGIDQNKDQTYFLCQLNQKQLQASLFPLGNITKQKVRKIAEELDLPVAHKKDSTGICFIGERDFKQFLQNYIPAKPGKMVDIQTGKVIGDHIGIMYYTIGQRKGLGIGGSGDAWFVVGKNYDRNILYICQGDQNDWLMSTGALITDVNWIPSIKPQEAIKCNTKFRYRQKDQDIEIERLDDTSVLVKYPQTIASVTEGQEAVFYDGDKCIGGGVIEEVFKDGKNLNQLIMETANGYRG